MSEPRPTLPIERLHLKSGWRMVAVFVALGAVLETCHAFKLGFYVDDSNATRRLMWTLAHAHGTLLGLMEIAFAFSVGHIQDWAAGSRRNASRSLAAATILIPSGFFLGGMFVHEGDPGLGVLLVPPGALLLFLAAFLTARAASRAGKSTN